MKQDYIALISLDHKTEISESLPSAGFGVEAQVLDFAKMQRRSLCSFIY